MYYSFIPLRCSNAHTDEHEEQDARISVAPRCCVIDEVEHDSQAQSILSELLTRRTAQENGGCPGEPVRLQ